MQDMKLQPEGYGRRQPALTSFITLTRARALMARPWSARCYGVARQRDGSRQNSIGGPALTLFLSLTRARALMARPWSARCYGVARQRDGSRQNSIGGPALTLFLTLTRARALMARQWSARCYGVARQREGSRQNSIGGSGVLSLRHFGLVLFIPWRVGAEEAGAAKYGSMASAAPSPI